MERRQIVLVNDVDLLLDVAAHVADQDLGASHVPIPGTLKWSTCFQGYSNEGVNKSVFTINVSFLNQTLSCDSHWNRLSETIPMSGHIIGFG